MSQVKYDPQRVEPKALSKLSASEREQVVACQQNYQPLSAALLNALEQVLKEVNNKH